MVASAEQRAPRENATTGIVRPARAIVLLCVAVTTVFLPHAVCAQQTLATGIANGAISCAPSNNNTGHMICVEYTTSGAVNGVSWQAPPGPRASEPVGTVLLASIGALAGAPVASPGCGPTNKGGALGCLLISSGPGGLTLQAVILYPPAPTIAPMLTTPIGSLPAGTPVGTPSCANAGANGTGANGAVVACAVVVNQAAQVIAFEPRTGFSIGLTPLAGLSNLVGNPSCASAGTPTTIVCAVRQGSGLTGFALQILQNGNTGTINYLGSLALPAARFSGDPSCAVIGNAPNQTAAVNCAIVSGASLLGINFDPQAGTAGLYQSLGAAPDAGTWNGQLGCGSFRTVGQQNVNLTGCAVVSSTGNVFRVTFDPQTNTALGPTGPFTQNVAGNLSCLNLFTDIDEMYCGGTTTGGTSIGLRLPVGLLNPAVGEVLNSLL